MNKRIGILGAGYIGETLLRTLDGAQHIKADIRDTSDLRKALVGRGWDIIINAAGKTGVPNVDWCESHLGETFDVNTVGALNVAKVCAEANARLIHFGSGCIFYGESPEPGGFRETDYANPESTYSLSKYAADLLLSRYPHVAIARIRMPIGGAPHPRNLISKLAKYKTVVDVENSVTVLDDLIEAIRALCREPAQGIFHVVNTGVMRHRDLLALYKKYVDPSHSYELVPETALLEKGLIARSRSNCILAETRLHELNVRMRPIEQALEQAMIDYGKALRAS